MKIIRFVPFSLLLVCAWSFAQEAYRWDNVRIGAAGFVSAVIPHPGEANLVYNRTDVGGAYRWDHDNQRWIPLTDWVSDSQVGLLGIESLALDPNDPDRLYLLAGISYFNNGNTAVLRSEDRGETFDLVNVTNQFRAHGNGMGRQSGEKMVVDPNAGNILYTGTRWNGLFRSTDHGATWSRMDSLDVTTTPNENGISFVLLDPDSASGGQSQTLIVGVSRFTSTGSNLYRSDDAGASFTAIAGAPTQHMPQRAALAADGNLYITYGNGAGPHGHWAVPEPMDQGQVWKYHLQSGDWTNVTPGMNRAYSGISVDPANPQRLLASTINTYVSQNGAWGDRIFLSENGGQSWTDIVDRGFSLDSNGIPWIELGHAIHWAGTVEFDPFNSNAAWVTSGNGVFKTSNLDTAPTVWKFDVHGLEETVPLGLVSIPGGPLVSVIGDYDGFIHEDVNEYAPIHQPQIGTTTGLAVATQNPELMVRLGNQMHYSVNGGSSWTRIQNINGSQGQVALSADGSVLLHSPNNSSTTYRSTDWGANWTAVTGLNDNNARPVADWVNPERFYAFTGTALRVSTDGGVSFTAAGSPGGAGSRLLRATPGCEGDIWVALNNGLARSVDGGETFTTIEGVSSAGAVGHGKAAASSEYPAVYIWGTVDGVRGIHRSTDAGATWVRVNDDQHQYGGPANGQLVLGDMNHFGRVYMSTAGRGLVYGEPAEPTDGAHLPGADSDCPVPSDPGGSSSSSGGSSSSSSSGGVGSSSSGSSSGGSVSPLLLLVLSLLFAGGVLRRQFSPEK